MSTYLITGASRGIGRGLLEALVKRPKTTVIAAIRDPSKAQDLAELNSSLSNGSRIVVVKVVSTSETDAKEAVEELKTKHGIDHIDIAIANAGISIPTKSVRDAPIADFRNHWEVNFLGPVILFQAVLPLLEKAAKPQFVIISSGLASIGDLSFMGGYPFSTYGQSKAAVNYIARKIHFENEHIITYPINPGWVSTDMGRAGAKAVGMDDAPVTLDQSVAGLLHRIDSATRENSSGRFLSFDDTQFSW